MKKHTNRQQLNFSTSKEIKIGVLSDTHSYINPSIFDRLTNCDLILHAGDIGSINVIKQLKEISPNVISVRGNNDNVELWQATEVEDLQNIPQIAEIELPGGCIVLTHGDEYYSDEAWHEKLRENFPDTKAIVYGHSHKLVCDQSENPWVLNPGPAGETRIKKHGVSCLVINATINNWDVTEFRPQ